MSTIFALKQQSKYPLETLFFAVGFMVCEMWNYSKVTRIFSYL